MRRVNESFNRLREEMLPILKTIKNETKPLPKPSSTSTATSTTPTYKDFDNAAYDRDTTYKTRGQEHVSESVDIRREPTPQPLLSQPPTRKYSVKKIDSGKGYFGKGAISPTTDTRSTIREQFATVKETNTMDSIASTLVPTPSSAIQSPPTTIVGKDRSESTISLPTASLPTPSSPHNGLPHNGGLGRSFSTNRTGGRYARREELPEQQHRARSRDRDTRRGQDHPPMASPPADDEGSNPPTVEIFKSFRVSMDDPCYKVLPAALKRYNIQADWQHYALYIVYGDQERCLGYEEKPLILFKQLDKEGKKPMFMLRRHINPESGQPSGVVTANPPGGVL